MNTTSSQPLCRRAIILGIDAASLRLLRRFVDEGLLPNIRRMMKEGAVAEAMSSLPCHTPTNWATISTGASTGTHGGVNWFGQNIGDHLTELPPHTWSSGGPAAETVWEAADRIGIKSVLFGFPSTWPPAIRHGYVVPLTWSAIGPVVVLRKGEIHELATPERHGGDAAKQWSTTLQIPGFAPPGQSGDAPLPWRFPDTPAMPYTVPPAPTPTPSGMRLRVDVEGEVVTLNVLEGEGRPSRLRPGDWSEWYTGDFANVAGEARGACRFKLLAPSAGGNTVRLVRSTILPTAGPAYPEALSAELTRELGLCVTQTALPLRTESPYDEVEVVLDEWQQATRWLAAAARYLAERDQAQGERPWDLCWVYGPWLDTAIHCFLPVCDRQSPAYDAQRAPFALSVLQRTCQLIDRMLGEFLAMADAQTAVFVVSDHGNAVTRWTGSVAARLVECGLLMLQNGQVDWQDTKVYVHGALHIGVNLHGRDRFGVVPPEEYERVQEAIIDALYTWKDPETGRRPIALTLKKQDAPLLGLWGDCIGDVVYLYNSGFSGRAPAVGSVGQSDGSADHGSQPPTATGELSSNMAVVLAWGPGIRAGYKRDSTRLGPARLVDVAPTLCHLLRMHPPAQSQGTVLYDMLAE